jgi:cobalamin 5'-phosphate synthase/cobalamin synthase
MAAFQFLTRLPVPFQFEYTDRVFRRSVIFYPLAGLVIGLILLAVGEGLRLLLPAMPAAVLLLGLWIAITGGLHLDGLMDTADGLLSHRPRDQMLEIMKDSRVGAMGVMAGVLQLLFKFSLLYSVLGMDQKGAWHAAGVLLVLVPVWSRWFMAAAIYGWPYARRESGLGSLFQSVAKRHVLASTIVALLIMLFVFLCGHRYLEVILPFKSLWIIAAGFVMFTCLLGWLIAAYMSRQLGGLTGDTYGALNELLEVLLLLGITVLF